MIIDAMDILYSNNIDGFCLVSSDSDFTRLATRIRESGKLVYGIGEKKTPNPFIASCDKFIYLEILKKEVEESNEGSSKKQQKFESITPKVKKFIVNTIKDLADDEGWAFMGEVGSLLQKKQPNFDPRNYGFQKLTPLISSIPDIEIETRDNTNGRFKLIYVRVK